MAALTRFIGLTFVLLLVACSSSGPIRTALPHKPSYERGMRVYALHCGECHDYGRRGAPTLDDVEDWDERALEWTTLMKSHISQGFMAMPPKGGKGGLSQHDIADALHYIQIKVHSNED